MFRVLRRGRLKAPSGLKVDVPWVPIAVALVEFDACVALRGLSAVFHRHTSNLLVNSDAGMDASECGLLAEQHAAA